VFAPRLHAKEQTFQVVEGARLQVYTNHTIMCHSVLANLLSNAIKFSPRGAHISLAARQENDRVHISVRDGGNGFPAEAMREQADATRTHLTSHAGTEQERGSGVGLRIAQHYLRELDGTLRIENRPDGGAEVTAILPVKTAYRVHVS
jgi:signal transduction histidine kinase